MVFLVPYERTYLSISSIFIDMQRLGNLWWLGHFYQNLFFIKPPSRIVSSTFAVKCTQADIFKFKFCTITNDDFCLHNGRERKWLLSPDQCSIKHYKNTIQVGSIQSIKPLKLVVAAYFICCILQLIHIEKQWGIFISP